MNLFGMLEVSGSALLAERQRAEVVTSNMANLETTRTARGGPYRRQLVGISRASGAAVHAGSELQPAVARAVRIDQVMADQSTPGRTISTRTSRCRRARAGSVSGY